MKSRPARFLLALALAVAARAAQPNILVILADDLGWGELGCQGFTREVPTPYIDSLAANDDILGATGLAARSRQSSNPRATRNPLKGVRAPSGWKGRGNTKRIDNSSTICMMALAPAHGRTASASHAAPGSGPRRL